jgi:hypothetical protein
MQTVTQTLPIGAIGTDLDKVLTIPSKIGQTSKAMGILGVKDTARGFWLYLTSKEFREKVTAAQDTNLKDIDGKPVIGSAAYVNYLFKDVPFITEEKKNQLAKVELYFKPNTVLIEYYQQLQDQGIIIYVWTDNDKGGYERKLNALNEELKKLGKKTLKPDGFHCAKPGTKEPGYSKIDPQYFRIAYENMMQDHGTVLQNKSILFLDDKEENIQSALKAKLLDPRNPLNLDALLYDSKKTELKKVEDTVGIAKATSAIA